MEKSASSTEASPATQSDVDTAHNKEEENADQYSSKATNKTSWKNFLVMNIPAELSSAIDQRDRESSPIRHRKLVGNFSDFFSPTSTTTKQEFTHTINKFTLLILYLFIARWCLSYISQFTFRIVGLRISAKLRLAYLKALFSLPVGVLDTLPSGQASNTITTTANTLQVGISDKLGVFLQCNSLLLVVDLGYEFRTGRHWRHIWLAERFFTSLNDLLSPRFIPELDYECYLKLRRSYLRTVIPIIMKMTKEVEHADEKASSIAGEVLGSIRMIVACGAESRIAKKYSGWVEESRKRALKKSPFIGIQFAPRTIVVVLSSVMMIAMATSQTAAPILAAAAAANAATDFFAVIDTPRPDTSGLKGPDITAREDLALESITFAYPSRPHVKVLDDLSIKFEAGKITAIVGASGSGKSTIVGLLERWYNLEKQEIVIPPSAVKDPKAKKDEEEKPLGTSTPEDTEKKVHIDPSGSVRCGSHELKAIDLKWWRSQIGLVQQEPFIFNDTIAKNVEYGLIGSEWEKADAETKKKLVVEACKEAFADEYITKLPQGYETQVGDAGIKLSGGQRQRLAIARSIIKRPKILILDEATSAIDVRGEQIVQAALDKVSEGRTTITIAHRLSTIKKADKIVRSRLPWYLILLFGSMGAGACYPLQAYIFAQLISVFQYTGAQLTAAANHWSLMFFILAIGAFVVWFGMGWASNTVAAHISSTYRQEYFESILRKPIPFFDAEDNSSGTLTARVANDPTQLQQLLGINMAMVLTAIFNITGCLIIGFVFAWKLCIVVAFVALPILLIGGYYRVRYEIQFEKMNQAVFAESSKFAAEAITAFRTVTSLTLEDMISSRYEELLDWHVNAAMKKSRWSTIAFAASESMGLLCMALTFYWGGKLLGNREFGPLAFFVVYIAVINGAETAGVLLSFGPSEYRCLSFCGHGSPAESSAPCVTELESILGTTRETDQGKSAAEVINAEGGVKIELKDVWFKYPTRDIPIFTGLSICVSCRSTCAFSDHHADTGQIEKGQFAALVGPSGCGKTSIVSLLERFYDVQKGRILCNDNDISELDVHDYRKSLSLVAQEPTLFEGTIKENILLGVNESTPEESLHRICRDAEIHDFIMSLPDGYSTNVGSKGVLLSGGQKQRIAIARALIRDPKILLLDEATSSLDSESEKLVQAAFERAGKGRTMVVVAHRLATVQNADVIFVLGEGRVLEVGDHQALLRKRGVYYQMSSLLSGKSLKFKLTNRNDLTKDDHPANIFQCQSQALDR
ncbi:putative leptomycin B resistance pmd1 protein [Rutstroemia sp. NJR-2017a BBW]|nr:putative leptomycin B resistance pmd1 protein [Rutstroemia sp. NJR-2017a BBW]